MTDLDAQEVKPIDDIADMSNEEMAISEPEKIEPVSQGEILESPIDESTDVGTVEDEGLEKAMQEAEDMIKDAHADLKDLGLDDIDGMDDDDFALPTTQYGSSAEDVTNEVTDTVTELEDMLKDADKELQELMGA